VRYDARKTAVLVIDPYNAFLSESGKVWPAIQTTQRQATTVDCHCN
jgi:hypothetical protein